MGEEFNSAFEDRLNKKEKCRKRIHSGRNYQKHLERLAKETDGFPSGAYYFSYWKDKTRKPYYKRIWRGKSSSYIKKICNRKIRRCKDLLQRGMKNKYTEFWWEYS